jgi:hypothetical protein
VFFTRPTAWGTRKNGYIHGEKRKRTVKEKGRKINDKINEIKKTGKTEKINGRAMHQLIKRSKRQMRLYKQLYSV